MVKSLDPVTRRGYATCPLHDLLTNGADPKLSQQIARLHQDMDARFVLVDAQLMAFHSAGCRQDLR